MRRNNQPRVQAGFPEIGLLNFREKQPQLVSEQHAPVEVHGIKTPAFFLSPEHPYDAPEVVHTASWEILKATEDLEDLCVLHYSILAAVLPELKETFLESLMGLDLDVTVVSVPNELDDYSIKHRGPMKARWALVMAAQCMLIMFKNIQPNNYEGFISKRIIALSAELGQTGPIASKVYSLSAATKLSAFMMREDRVRRELIRSLQARASLPTPMGRVSTYVLKISAYSEMAALTFMFQALLMSASPVLSDIRVAEEVNNMVIAFRAVCHSSFPQFFRVFATPTERRVLDRANFPVLVTVSQKILSSRQATADQYNPAEDVDNPLIPDLVSIHEEYMKVATTKARVSKKLMEEISSLLPGYEDVPEEVNPAPQ